MLNHARTLLLNADHCPDGHFGSEIVPCGFTAIPLTRALTTVRRILYGARPDQVMLDYRLWQCMTLLHAGPMREYLTAFDPRISYTFAASVWSQDTLFTPSVEPERPTTSTLTLLGGPASPDKTGETTFDIRVSTGGGFVECEQYVPATFWSVTRTAMTDTEYALGPTGYRFRIKPLVSDQAWRITTILRPQRSLIDLVNDLDAGLSEEDLSEIFPWSAEEPVRTFSEVWRSHPEKLHRLAGLLFGVVYATEALRRLRDG